MKDNFTHIETKNGKNQPDLSPYSNLEPPYKKNKDEVWQQLLTSMDNQDEKIRSLSLFSRQGIMPYAIAAMVAILIGIPLFMRFYSKTMETGYGEHASLILPDNSDVRLNAGTTVSYHPFWWRFSRELKMEGEAFFEVTKGESFTVISKLGETTVLGTSFNIYTRDDNYVVNCLTGKVKVSDFKDAVVILPDQKAELLKGKGLIVDENAMSNSAVSWINKEFVYTGESLMRVLSDIEIQFNVKINKPVNLLNDSLTYTGNFTGTQSAEKVLYFVLKPFGLSPLKTEDGVYELKYEN